MPKFHHERNSVCVYINELSFLFYLDLYFKKEKNKTQKISMNHEYINNTKTILNTMMRCLMQEITNQSHNNIPLRCREH